MVVCLCIVSVVPLSFSFSLYVVCRLLCSSVLGLCVPGVFLLCVSLHVPCVSWLSVGWYCYLGCLCLLSLLGVFLVFSLLVVCVSLVGVACCPSCCVSRVSVLLVGVF